MIMDTTERSSGTLKYLTNRGTSTYAKAVEFLNSLDVNVRYARIRPIYNSNPSSVSCWYMTEVWI